MAKPDSWMPVYWGDLWNKTRDLTAVEQCAYYNLLGSMWMEGGSLPNDNVRLQRMSRVTEKEWRTVSATVTAYFDRGEDGRLYQKRLTEEYAKAMKAYTARSQHMANVNSKRTQSPSTVTVTTTADTTHNSHTPSGVKASNEALADKPKRRSQIPADWKPNPKDIAHASSKGLDPATITALGEQFLDHHTAKGTVLASVSAAWRTWVNNHINWHGTGPWPKRDADKRPGNRSVIAARDSILAKAGVRPERGAEAVSNCETDWPERNGPGAANLGPVVDADDWRETSESADGIEVPDEADTGDHGGHRGADGGVPQAAAGVPSGCGGVRADDAAGCEPVVACMVGTEGTLRDAHIPQAADAGGFDPLEIPACLRRLA